MKFPNPLLLLARFAFAAPFFLAMLVRHLLHELFGVLIARLRGRRENSDREKDDKHRAADAAAQSMLFGFKRHANTNRRVVVHKEQPRNE